MITRRPRPKSNFYLLDKAISEDKRMSWAARGMLVYLLGKPDHWKVSPAALTNETKGLKRGTGRDGVYAILNELKEVGYLQASGVRDASGSFAGTDYTIGEVAIPPSVPHPSKPDTAGPDTAGPRPANPPQARIDSKQGLNDEQGLNLSSASLPPCPHESLIDLYAKSLPALPQPRKSLWRSGKNEAAMRARWRWVMTECYETGERAGQRMATTTAEGLAWFDRYFTYVSKSDFLTGRNDKFSACDLGWLVKADNFAKVLSGNYDNRVAA